MIIVKQKPLLEYLRNVSDQIILGVKNRFILDF